jgi:serine/threonine protein kinase
VPSSANACIHAIALARAVLPREALDRALGEAETRGRPLERHLVETGAVSRDLARELEVERSRQARACSACRKLTYLLPGRTEAETPCEHCAGALAPAAAPKSASHPAPKSASHPAPKSAPHPAPRSGAHPAPAAARPAPPEKAPAPASDRHPKPAPSARPPSRPAAPAAAQNPALIDDDDDPILPARIGGARIEAVLAENPRIVVYAGRWSDERRVAVRSLKPHRATSRRDVDRFLGQARAAAPAGLEPLEVGVDMLGAPFLTVRRPDELDLGPVLLGLDTLDASGEGEIDGGSSDTNTGIFEKLNRQRQELRREVNEASRRRERCVGKYVLLELRSVDAGELWRAFDSEKNELVDVRLFPAAPALENGRLRKDLDESLTVAERMRHASIVTPLAHGVDGQRLYIVRDHVSASAHPISAGTTLELVVKQVQQAAQALVYAHPLGVIHGGLCPDNVVVRGDRSIGVIGFGVAETALATRSGGVAWDVVRAGFVAPELAGGQPGTVAGDIYALGAILFRAAVHHLPDEPAPGSAPDAPSDVLAIASRCLEPAPADRYATARDLERDLERVVQEKVPLTREAPPPKAAPAEATKSGSSVVGALSGVFKKWLGRG